jgi:hypothetical protein
MLKIDLIQVSDLAMNRLDFQYPHHTTELCYQQQRLLASHLDIMKTNKFMEVVGFLGNLPGEMAKSLIDDLIPSFSGTTSLQRIFEFIILFVNQWFICSKYSSIFITAEIVI